MTSEVEKRFREAERRLDELLRGDEAALAARGVAVADWSVRAYNYKSEYLCWSYRFETRRARERGREGVGRGLVPRGRRRRGQSLEVRGDFSGRQLVALEEYGGEAAAVGGRGPARSGGRRP